MVKIGNYFIVSVFVLGLLSCNKADSIDNSDVASPEEVSDFKMSIEGVGISKSSRVSVDENLSANGGLLQVRWDEGDKVRMMVGSSAEDVVACDFTLVGGSSMGVGNFEYIGNKVETNYYYGVYPPMEIGTGDNVLLTVPVDGTISQAADDDSRHLGMFRPMYAPPVYNEEGGSVLKGVVFKHLTSLIIFKVTNSTDEAFKLSYIEMSTADGNKVFYSSASFNPKSQTEAVVNGAPSASVAFGFDDNGMPVAPQEMRKAYLPVLPTGDFSSSQLRVRAVTDKGEFISDIPMAASETLKSFKAGNYCIFNLKKTKSGITVGMEIQGWEDGEIVDVPLL